MYRWVRSRLQVKVSIRRWLPATPPALCKPHYVGRRRRIRKKKKKRSFEWVKNKFHGQHLPDIVLSGCGARAEWTSSAGNWWLVFDKSWFSNNKTRRASWIDRFGSWFSAMRVSPLLFTSCLHSESWLTGFSWVNANTLYSIIQRGSSGTIIDVISAYAWSHNVAL